MTFFIDSEINNWNQTKLLIYKEFGLSNLAENALQWLFHPLEKAQQSDPLITAIWSLFTIWTICFILNLLTKNYSWVDRLWSTLPPAYTWFFALSIPLPSSQESSSFDFLSKIQFITSHHPRVLVMTLLPTLWGARLTFNFARKGGYKLTGEDYRWAWVHSSKAFHIPILGSLLWQIFSLIFITGYQLILIFWFITPSYTIYRDTVDNLHRVQSLTLYDWILTGAFLFLLAFETIADNQQWNYYQRRENYRALSKEKQRLPEYQEEARGFNTGGLFAYSRHPNFFAERTIWWVYYLFVIGATGLRFHWSILGVLQLNICIFPGSTSLTEKISLSKYPAYKIYQKYVPTTIPAFVRPKIKWDQKLE